MEINKWYYKQIRDTIFYQYFFVGLDSKYGYGIEYNSGPSKNIHFDIWPMTDNTAGTFTEISKSPLDINDPKFKIRVIDWLFEHEEHFK